jgi:hypothetical protein
MLVNAQFSSMTKITKNADGTTIQHIESQNGEIEYLSRSADGKRSRYSSDLWQAEMYCKEFTVPIVRDAV